MPGGNIVPRSSVNVPMSRGTVRDLTGIRDEVYIAEAEVRASSALGEYTFSEIAYLSRVRMDLELANPAAADALAAIANITNAHIARTVMQFGSRW
jgi:hypothetical protein